LEELPDIELKISRHPDREMILFFDDQLFIDFMSLKNEVLVLLIGVNVKIANQLIDDVPATRYCRSVFLLLKKENAMRVDEFVPLYRRLLAHARMEVLSVQAVVLLYQKWLKYPMIVEDMEILQKKLMKNKVSEHLWLQFIRSSALDKTSRTMQKARVHLLANAINSGVLEKEELNTYGIVIDTILRITIHPDDHRILKRGFGRDYSHFYRCMFFVIRRLVKQKTDKLELVEIIRRHFSPADRTLPWTEPVKEFYEVLELKLPANYLLHLNRSEIRKMYFLYSQQPGLFSKLTFDQSEKLTLKTFIRFLFQDFMISGVFLHAFCEDTMNDHEKEWFIDELKGRNIVHSALLPTRLTKKAAHFFRCMTEDVGLSVSRSLIYAQVSTLVEDRAFALAVAFGVRNISQADFWIETISGLHRKGLQSGDVQEVMDYINEKVFVRGEVIDLKHKKLENLKREIEAWHEQLRAQTLLRRIGTRKLPDAEIPEFIILIDDSVYAIKQLKRTNELFDEGSSLSHCVYTYRKYCMRKETFIFSLRRFDLNSPEIPLITIELDRFSRIHQAKGKFNRQATDEEKSIIRMWALENKLKYAS
jgi:hypothetical protein